MRDFSLPVTVRRGPRSGDSAEGHVPRDQKPVVQSERLHWQKTSEISTEFQKITLRRWVFRFGFFGVFRGSCLATFSEKPECEKDSGFLMPM